MFFLNLLVLNVVLDLGGNGDLWLFFWVVGRFVYCLIGVLDRWSCFEGFRGYRFNLESYKESK